MYVLYIYIFLLFLTHTHAHILLFFEVLQFVPSHFYHRTFYHFNVLNASKRFLMILIYLEKMLLGWLKGKVIKKKKTKYEVDWDAEEYPNGVYTSLKLMRYCNEQF